jgi:hypothetical protein
MAGVLDVESDRTAGDVASVAGRSWRDPVGWEREFIAALL